MLLIFLAMKMLRGRFVYFGVARSCGLFCLFWCREVMWVIFLCEDN